MSSKRKNTPTKIAASPGGEERSSPLPPSHHAHNKERHDSVASSAADSDCFSEVSSAGSPIHGNFDQLRDGENTSSDLETNSNGSLHSPGSDKPRTKKQRLLQSIRMSPELNTYNNESGNTNTSVHSTEASHNQLNLINNNLNKTTSSPQHHHMSNDEDGDDSDYLKVAKTVGGGQGRSVGEMNLNFLHKLTSSGNNGNGFSAATDPERSMVDGIRSVLLDAFKLYS